MKHSFTEQSGAGLVELLVAMVVASLVILGASQLFLGIQQNARVLDSLSERQAVVSYAMEEISAGLRRGDTAPEDYELRTAPNGHGCSLYDSLSGQPLVDGLGSTGICGNEHVVEDIGHGIYRITLHLPDVAIPLVLHAVDRSVVLDQFRAEQ
uniref:PilW family protein n=1 Tax=Halomonas sp. TaxID=1486246 RepID=UPI002611A9FD|nr:hypothetical protein [Halomonas sp.]